MYESSDLVVSIQCAQILSLSRWRCMCTYRRISRGRPGRVCFGSQLFVSKVYPDLCIQFFFFNRCIDITFETSFTFTFCSAHVRCIYASQRFLPGQCQSYGAAYLADHVTKIFTSRCLEIGTSGNVFHKTCHLNYQKCLGFHSSIVLIIF